MKKPIAITIIFTFICFIANGFVFAQEVEVPAFILENDIGKITYLFTNSEAETRLFYNGVKNLFEDDMFHYAFDDPSEQRQELIGIFSIMHDQFFYDLRNHPETFILVADVDESQMTEHRFLILSMSTHKIDTDFGLIEYLNFVYITSAYGDEVLFCNIE